MHAVWPLRPVRLEYVLYLDKSIQLRPQPFLLLGPFVSMHSQNNGSVCSIGFVFRSRFGSSTGWMGRAIVETDWGRGGPSGDEPRTVHAAWVWFITVGCIDPRWLGRLSVPFVVSCRRDRPVSVCCHVYSKMTTDERHEKPVSTHPVYFG
jgi:hypothetical protein